LLDRGVILGSQGAQFAEVTVGDEDTAALVSFGVYLTADQIMGLAGLIEQVVAFMTGQTTTVSGQPLPWLSMAGTARCNRESMSGRWSRSTRTGTKSRLTSRATASSS